MEKLIVKKTSCIIFTILQVCLLFSLLTGCKEIDFVTRIPAAANEKGECVILFHGMARSHHSMEGMQDFLTGAGYHTVNVHYPSTSQDVATISSSYFDEALARCAQFKPDTIHLVSHSLGGIIIRYSLQKKLPAKLGRVVMLSPPNKGSEATDNLKDWALYKWLNGPAGQQLGTAPDSLPNRLGPATFPVGIITGDEHALFDWWLAEMIPGKDDGKVSIESAKLDGMIDFLVVSESHPFIMDAEDVQRQTLHFLQHETFEHQK